jgi:hypothetical protein
MNQNLALELISPDSSHWHIDASQESIGGEIAGICYTGVTTDYPKWSITQVVQVGVSAHMTHNLFISCGTRKFARKIKRQLSQPPTTHRTQHFACHVLRIYTCIGKSAFCFFAFRMGLCILMHGDAAAGDLYRRAPLLYTLGEAFGGAQRSRNESETSANI